MQVVLRQLRIAVLAFLFVNGYLHAQIAADFLAIPTSGCSPLIVQFNDLSTGNPSNWNWDFGNGSSSSQSNPTIVYNAPGTYTVTLTVDDGTNSDTETKAAYITVYGPPVVQFTAQPGIGCVPVSVQFTDQSSSGSAITSRIWNFGDGNTSSQQNPINNYTFSGNYTVSLSISDANGCNGTASVPNMVQVVPQPQAIFSSPDTLACAAPHTVNFSNTSSTGPNSTYTWDFGDGNTSSAANPTHTYTSDGNYTVSLIVSDPAGCSDTLAMGNFVQIGGPVAAFSSGAARVCLGDSVSFQDLTTGNVSSWQWDFGDGNQSTNQNPVHSYAAPGIYTVTQIVSDAASCSDTLVQPNFVEVVAAPIADFSADTLISCEAPFQVNFSDLSTGAVSWSWDFGDGNTSTLANPSHTYTGPGQYDVQLVVANADSCRDTLLRSAYIQVIPPVAAFNYSIVQGGCIPRTVMFTDSSYTGLGTITAWNWDFGDGATSVLQNPNHTYTVANVYTLTLVVTTTGGCRDTLVVPNFIGVGPDPVANFTGAPLTMCYGDTIQFTNTSSNATNFIWDFGDTFTSGSVNPIHVYPLPGCYDVQLIADTYNCPDTLLRTNYVCVQGVRADFTWSPAFACDTPATVTFTSIPNGPNLKWQWTFGDGNYGSGSSATNTYTQAGAYPVTMLVEDTLIGCLDSITHVFLLSSPDAGFTTDTTAGCVPFTVNFTDTTALAASWLWDFGDGSTDTLPNPSHQYTTAGNYDIQLIAAYANGCSDTAFFPALISAHDVVADFGTASNLLCTGLSNAFTDLSSGTSAVNTWSWTFGDGGMSNLANPAYAYPNPGLYTVSLAVTDANGCTDSIVRTDLEMVLEPVAAFSLSDTILCPGELLQLTNQSSGLALTFAWDFGDGNSSTLTSPGHPYAQTGSYPISLVVSDSAGCQDTTLQNMQISLPMAAFSVSDSVRSCPPLVVNFTNNSTGNIASYNWDFGDGSTSQLANPSHVYNSPGSFDVVLIVTTATGCADTLIFPNRIDLSGPSATITLDRDTICSGDTITLTAGGATVSGLTWIFGDGNVSIGNAVAQHGYQSAGNYLPTLVLQDSLGCTVFLFAPDSVYVLPPPIPGFSVSSAELCDPGQVSFTDQSQYFSPAASWNWSFGDGGSSNQTNPGHNYTTPGTYPVSLSLTDSMGCTSVVTQASGVVVHAQNALFSTDTTSGCVPLSVNFTDNSSADTTILSWNWTFGDGTTAAGPGGSHTYIDSGYFDLGLVITTAAGCSDTLSLPAGIYAYLPDNSTAPEMLAATVVNNAEIDLNWVLPAFRGAGGVLVERSADGTNWATLTNLNPGVNQYRDANVDVISNSYRYRVSLTDSCGGISPLSRTARSILLQINDQTGTGQLSWNGYTDWAGGVERYDIEARDQNGTTWQTIGTAGGGQNSFTDASLNDVDGGRCYRIRAFEMNGNLASSLSNEACGRSELWVPNTITPNGDGANDYLVISALAGFPGSSIEIFNRWGGLVYASSDYQNDWDGTHQGTGEALPDGTYFYLLRLSDGLQVFKGYTTIMR